MPSSDPLPPKESALFRKILVSCPLVSQSCAKLCLFRTKKFFESILDFVPTFTRFLKIHFVQVVSRFSSDCYSLRAAGNALNVFQIAPFPGKYHQFRLFFAGI